MAAEGGVKLMWAWASPFSWRAEVALKLKGVPYEHIEEDLSNKSPLLLKHNPVHKKIPVLVHDGKPIPESLLIIEYIDETWKENPILPRDPHERAVARFWAKFVDDKCIPPIIQALTSRDEKAVGEARENFRLLENELKGKKFFGGETIGIVDIAALFIGFWVEVIQEAAGLQLLEEEEFPILCKWSKELLNIGAIKESIPDRDKLLSLFQARFAATPSPAPNASDSK